MKESVRLIGDLGFTGYDIIFIARNTINGKKCADVKWSISSALKKAALGKNK